MEVDLACAPEHTFALNANLKAHVPLNTGHKPFIQVEVFVKALQSCADFIAEWATWQMRRKASHQSVSLARSFRTYLVNPLRNSVLRIANCNHIEKYQTECDEWREALPFLFHVLNTSIPCAQNKSAIYTVLYEQLGRVPAESLAFSILCQAWQDALRILANQVRRAVLDGEIDDFYSEFFIEEILRTDSETGDEIKLPFQRYRLVLSRLPKFISLQTAENILFAIHAIDCNSLIRNEHMVPGNSFNELEKTAVSAQEIANAFQRMASDPDRSCLILDAASLQWRKRAASVLSDILPVDDIRTGLATLRAHLLLGNELFWRSFFDELRLHDDIFKEQALTDEEQTRAERILNNILISLHTEHSGSSIRPRSAATSRNDSAIPLVLKINSAGSVIPEYALNNTESILLARAAPVYCDIFSIAFSVRRVGCELQKCFQMIMLLSKIERKSGVSGTFVKQSIHSLSLLRMRMAVVINALEFYVQCAVVQPQYEKLDGILERWTTEKGSRTPSRKEIPLFDEFGTVQDESVKTITDQCFLENDMVVKRYQEIFSSCLSFCASVKSVIDDQQWSIEQCMEQTSGAAKIFNRNVSLLAKLFEQINASCLDTTVFELQRQLNEAAKFTF